MPSPSPFSPTRTTRSSAAALAAVALLALGCAGASTEHQLLTRFFEASRQYDRTRLAPVATVVFNPRTDGTVQAFAILTVSVQSDTTKRATVRARVRTPSGEMVERTLLVTFERAAAPRLGCGRWFISGVRQQATAAS